MGDDPVFGSSSKKVGMKQSLVYYLGEAPGGVRTNWIMHEYRLSNGTNSGSSSSRSSKRKGHPMIVCTSSPHIIITQVMKTLDWLRHLARESNYQSFRLFQDYSKWVVCRVYERGDNDDGDDNGAELSCLDEVFLSLDDLDEISTPN